MFEEKYMLRAIELAKKGMGAVNPNPLVGAVIVKDGRIIGEGYHARYGELHAERTAFKNLTEDAEGAEMYVTLEPCCHFGKQPPCTHAIVEHKIKKVYVGSDDPNEKVAGKGIAYLRANGVEVFTQQLKEECDKLNSIFFHYITTKTPYVMMKYAMTMDGKIATKTGASKWITNEASRLDVQRKRNEYMGIMVGIGTVLADNPMLNCRIEGGRNPVRIICDSKLRIPLDSNIVKTAGEIKTIVAAATPTDRYKDELLLKKKALEEKGINVILTEQSETGTYTAGETEPGKVNLKQLMQLLGEQGIDGIMLEGGADLNYSAIDAGIVQEVRVYIAPKIFGGKEAKTPVGGEGIEIVDMAKQYRLVETEMIDNDIVLTYKKIPPIEYEGHNIK